jgi:hypothetical protein
MWHTPGRGTGGGARTRAPAGAGRAVQSRQVGSQPGVAAGSSPRTTSTEASARWATRSPTLPSAWRPCRPRLPRRPGSAVRRGLHECIDRRSLVDHGRGVGPPDVVGAVELATHGRPTRSTRAGEALASRRAARTRGPRTATRRHPTTIRPGRPAGHVLRRATRTLQAASRRRTALAEPWCRPPVRRSSGTPNATIVALRRRTSSWAPRDRPTRRAAPWSSGAWPPRPRERGAVLRRTCSAMRPGGAPAGVVDPLSATAQRCSDPSGARRLPRQMGGGERLGRVVEQDDDAAERRADGGRDGGGEPGHGRPPRAAAWRSTTPTIGFWLVRSRRSLRPVGPFRRAVMAVMTTEALGYSPSVRHVYRTSGRASSVGPRRSGCCGRPRRWTDTPRGHPAAGSVATPRPRASG